MKSDLVCQNPRYFEVVHDFFLKTNEKRFLGLIVYGVIAFGIVFLVNLILTIWNRRKFIFLC